MSKNCLFPYFIYLFIYLYYTIDSKAPTALHGHAPTFYKTCDICNKTFNN